MPVFSLIVFEMATSILKDAGPERKFPQLGLHRERKS